MAKDTSKQPKSPRLANKKARFNYEILEKVEAGIELRGTEVKSLRLGNASITEAYARIEAGQATLHNFQIQPYEQGNRFNHDPKRPRRLLLHRREIRKLASKVQIRGQTLVPLGAYFNSRGLVKVQLALARGKTHGDKRHDERKKQDQQDIKRAMRR